ncbi:MAG: MlaE family lipid ABC transporter permease subunit [Gammaproteobacteria bacterium]|nr:MlaE family lipid ABC transporter permease subunit [Gammaproteobacteria bacterium]
MQGEPQRIELGGDWTTMGIARIEPTLDRQGLQTTGATTPLLIDASQVVEFDTAGAWLLNRLLVDLNARGCEVTLVGLSDSRRSILEATARHIASDSGTVPSDSWSLPFTGWLRSLGETVWLAGQGSLVFLSFVGEICLCLLRHLLVPTRLPVRPVLAHIRTAGVDGLPIIGLLAFLIGIVVAYQGGVQLRSYGAEVFIVELVTITTVREFGPLIAAIIVAGRTGAAVAAQLGTMKVSQEVDALRAMGLDPVDLLVLPRVLGLVVAMPLLSMFADVLGVAGGMVMAYSTLGVDFNEFFQRIPEVVGPEHFLIGILKAPVFALCISSVGCFHGMQASGGAESVGTRTTMSVVHGIFLVIVADAAFSILFSALGI